MKLHLAIHGGGVSFISPDAHRGYMALDLLR